MARFQKTIVRYERNPRAREDADFWEKWSCPSFLGTDDEGKTCWYGYCFEDLIAEGKVHEIFYFDSYNLPSKNDEHYYEALRNAQKEYIDCGKNLIMSLMQLDLLEKSFTTDYGDAHVRPVTIKYCYRFEGYRFEHNVIKELLGLDIEDNQHCTPEQFEQLRKLQDKRWQEWGKLINAEIPSSFVDLSGLAKMEAE